MINVKIHLKNYYSDLCIVIELTQEEIKQTALNKALAKYGNAQGTLLIAEDAIEVECNPKNCALKR